MAKPRDYKAEYLSRKARAQEQGYSGYGQKRYRAEKVKIEKAKEERSLKALLEEYGAIPISEVALEPKREDAYQRLLAKVPSGYAGLLMKHQVEALRHAPREDFWPIYRDLYQKLVM